MLFVGTIIVVIALVIYAAAQASHKRETGVTAPSRKTMSYLRRQARKNGISEDQAYEDWLVQKQRKAGLTQASAPTASDPRYTIAPAEIEGGEQRFSFHCDDCGGYEIHIDDEPPAPTSVASCTACGQPLGTLADIERVTRTVGANYGMKLTGAIIARDRDGKVA